MRNALIPAAACFAALALAGGARAQTHEVTVCSSRGDAELMLEAGRPSSLPEGCRTATVRRIETPAGQLCAIDIGGRSGVVAALRDAVAETEWWTSCANLRVP